LQHGINKAYGENQSEEVDHNRHDLKTGSEDGGDVLRQTVLGMNAHDSGSNRKCAVTDDGRRVRGTISDDDATDHELSQSSPSLGVQ